MDILRRESSQKDDLFSKELIERQSASTARDTLRAELNKVSGALNARHGYIRRQQEEVRALHAVVDGIEGELLSLKRRYEVAVEDRNYTGIQLIDRNDELCVLYEQAHAQQGTLSRGEIGLQRLDREAHDLDLHVAALCRDVESVRRGVPRLPHLEERLLRTQGELEEATAHTSKLSAVLENPANQSRWRQLPGRVPDAEDLAAKIAVLQERLSDRKEQLLEKDLILDEVTALAGRLRNKATQGRDETLQVATDVNAAHTRLRVLTRRMMAAVSELSMYQATALKLTHDNTELTTLVDACVAGRAVAARRLDAHADASSRPAPLRCMAPARFIRTQGPEAHGGGGGALPRGRGSVGAAASGHAPGCRRGGGRCRARSTAPTHSGRHVHLHHRRRAAQRLHSRRGGHPKALRGACAFPPVGARHDHAAHPQAGPPRAGHLVADPRGMIEKVLGGHPRPVRWSCAPAGRRNAPAPRRVKRAVQPSNGTLERLTTYGTPVHGVSPPRMRRGTPCNRGTPAFSSPSREAGIPLAVLLLAADWSASVTAVHFPGTLRGMPPPRRNGCGGGSP